MKKKYYIHYMILFIMVLFLTSCGKKTVQQKLEDTIPLSKNPGKLKVVLAVPYGSTSDQSQLDQITVTFNQAMSPLTSISDDSYTGSIKFDPDIKGKYRWISPATLSFTPETPLPPGTKIDAEVPAGTRSLNGVSLEKSYKWSFETLRPAIKESYPANEQKLVGLKDKIYLLFNIPVNDTNKDDLIKLTEYNDSKKNLPITIRRLNHTDTEIVKKWSDQKTDNILVITPEEPLKPSMSYYVTISAGYKAKSGDLGLLKDQFIEFSTQNIFDMKPLENIKHDPSQELSIVFTNPVYLKELMKNISFTPEIKIPDYYSDNDYDSEYQRLDLNFQPDTNYKAVISSNMKDIFGNSLGKNITFKFKTTDYSPDIALAEGSGKIGRAHV